MSEFTVNEIQNISLALKETSDYILSFHYSENCILIGTAKGSIHIIDIVNNEGMMFGPYNYPIKDLTGQGDTFAYTTSTRVVLFNKKSRKEVFSYSSSYEKVLIWSNSLGNLALICATTFAIHILQKGWVNVSVKTLKNSYKFIQSLKNNSHLLCLIDTEKAEIVNLSNEEVLFSARLDEGIGHFHWYSIDYLLFSTGYFIDFLKYNKIGKESLTPTERINISTVPNSLSSIKQYIIYNNDKVFMLGLERETLISQTLPSYGKILSNGKNDSKLILFTSSQVFILNLPNIKENILALINDYKLEQAQELIEKYHISSLNDLQPFIDDLIRRGRFEDASIFVNNAGLESQNDYSKELIQNFANNYKLHLICESLPYIENSFMNSLIIHSLTEHKDLLTNYLKKIPDSYKFEKTVLNQIKSSGFSETLLEIFLHRNLVIDAFELCLFAGSDKTFELLEKFPENNSEFSQISGFYQRIFEIDVEKAFKFCETWHNSSLDVLNWLSPDKIIKVLAQQELDLKHEEMFLDKILEYCPEKLKKYLHKFRNLSIDLILTRIQNTNLDDLKVFLHQQQENKAEVLKILKKNFLVRINYLKNYPELWMETLNEARASIEKTRQVLHKIHYFENALEFIKTLDFHQFDKEIRKFIIKFGSLVKLHKLSVSAARREEFLIFKQLFEEQAKGIFFTFGSRCCRCRKEIYELSLVRLRKCGHHSHKDCLDKCILCIDASILKNN